MASLRTTSLVEEIHPKLRRHTSGNYHNFFRTAVGGAFISIFQQVNKRPSIQDNQQIIKDHHIKINKIVDEVDQHIAHRLQIHEQEVFSIVKGEIDEMRQRTEERVRELNQSIAEKNVNNQLWHLNNELDYFKNEAFKLFEDNKRLRIEVKCLKKRIEQYASEQECLDATLQKMRKRELKRQFDRKKSKKQYEKKVQVQISQRYQNNSLRQLSRQVYQIEDKRGDQSEQSAIQINLEQNEASSVHFSFNQDKIVEESLPSLNTPTSSVFQPLELQKVQSFQINNSSSLILAPRCFDKAIQTDLTFSQSIGVNSLIQNDSPSKASAFMLGRKRCNTERNIEPSSRKIDFRVKESKGPIWVEKHDFKVINRRKQSKSILYMSSVIANSKLRPAKMLDTSRPFKTHRE